MVAPPLSLEESLRVVPRPASTTLIVRDGPPGLEILMVRRSLQASFMPGAYVFPGGGVDKADGDCPCDETPETIERRLGAATGLGPRAAAHAVAALRECFEECGLWLGGGPAGTDWAALRARVHNREPFAAIARDAGLTLATSRLEPWARWCTPFGRPKRFDTAFFIVRAPDGQTPTVDEGETITLEWVHPPAALAARRAGGFPMEFATVENMKALAACATGTAALFAHAATLRPVPFISPRLKVDADGKSANILLPGQPGYDTAFGAGH